MSVKIRLTRMGKKKQPSYRVVVIDSRKPRDGAYLEQIGFYDPRQDPSVVEIDNENDKYIFDRWESDIHSVFDDFRNAE